MAQTTATQHEDLAHAVIEQLQIAKKEYKTRQSELLDNLRELGPFIAVKGYVVRNGRYPKKYPLALFCSSDKAHQFGADLESLAASRRTPGDASVFVEVGMIDWNRSTFEDIDASLFGPTLEAAYARLLRVPDESELHY